MLKTTQEIVNKYKRRNKSLDGLDCWFWGFQRPFCNNRFLKEIWNEFASWRAWFSIIWERGWWNLMDHSPNALHSPAARCFLQTRCSCVGSALNICFNLMAAWHSRMSIDENLCSRPRTRPRSALRQRPCSTLCIHSLFRSVCLILLCATLTCALIRCVLPSFCTWFIIGEGVQYGLFVLLFSPHVLVTAGGICTIRPASNQHCVDKRSRTAHNPMHRSHLERNFTRFRDVPHLTIDFVFIGRATMAWLRTYVSQLIHTSVLSPRWSLCIPTGLYVVGPHAPPHKYNRLAIPGLWLVRLFPGHLAGSWMMSVQQTEPSELTR